MKKFFEELEKASAYMKDIVPISADAEQQYKELRDRFSALVGRRGLYTCKSEKESKVVVIVEATKNYVVMEYNYYGMGYQGKLRTSVTYGALICGEDRLDVE